jgi:YtkA-like
MKKVVLLTLVFLLIGGIAYANEFTVQKKAGAYDIAVKIDRNPPIVGDNNMTISVKDASGKAVTDAKVTVTYMMPAMPGMPAMHYRSGAALKGSDYAAKMTLSMAGSWNVTLKVMRAGKTSMMKFTVDAH